MIRAVSWVGPPWLTGVLASITNSGLGSSAAAISLDRATSTSCLRARAWVIVERIKQGLFDGQADGFQLVGRGGCRRCRGIFKTSGHNFHSLRRRRRRRGSPCRPSKFWIRSAAGRADGCRVYDSQVWKCPAVADRAWTESPAMCTLQNRWRARPVRCWRHGQGRARWQCANRWILRRRELTRRYMLWRNRGDEISPTCATLAELNGQEFEVAQNGANYQKMAG